MYIYIYINKTPYIILKIRRGTEIKNVCIKQQKSLFHYQQKIWKHAFSTFEHHQKIFMSEPWNTKLRSV